LTNEELAADSSQLAQCVAALAERLQAGEQVDIGELCADCPEYVEQLEMLLPTLEAIVDLEHSLDRDGADGLDSSATAALPLPGVLGDFRIVREIGRGGMGVVYEAQQISLNRRVALKVLPFAAMLESRRLERFRHEAQAAAMLRHPHIVTVYSVGCERGVHYYAMDLVEGPSLAEVVEALRAESVGQRAGISGVEQQRISGVGEKATDYSTSPLLRYRSSVDTQAAAALSTLRTTQPAEYFRSIARLGIQAAEALDYAHQLGVVHRDIKPSNLLLECSHLAPRDEVSKTEAADSKPHHVEDRPWRTERDVYTPKLWITDFGLAMTQSDAGLTMTGDLLGTLRYMSPEQAAGKRLPLDHRTDVYSLGITLYELLAGRPAFDATDRGELLRAIAEVYPPSLRTLAPTVPVDMETIVQKAMEKDAADRYSSAGDLAADLRRFLENRPIVARPPSLASRVRKWARRHSSLVALSAVLLLVMLAGLAVSTWLIGRQAKRAESNLNLALAALEQTLADSVVGDLIVESSEPARVELERRGIAFFEQFARDNGLDAKIWPTYRVLLYSQRLQQAVSHAEQNPERADQAFRDAISEAAELVVATNGEPQYRAHLIHAIDAYGVFLAHRGRERDALRQSNRANQLAVSLVRAHPDFPQIPYLQGQLLFNRAKRYEAVCAFPEAERCYRESLAFLEQATATEPNELRNVYAIASCRYNLATLVGQRQNNDEAAELWEKSLQDWRTLTMVDPLSSEHHSRVGATLSNLAALASYRKDFQRCRELAEEALAIQKQALKLEPVYKLAEDFLATHYKILSRALAGLGDHTALAAIADQRVQMLPEAPREHCAAAVSLADCLPLLNKDDRLAPQQREELAARYVQRAQALLTEAGERFRGWDKAEFTVAYGSIEVGDRLAAVQHSSEAQQSWQYARTLLTNLRAEAPPAAQREIDKLYLKPLEKRLAQKLIPTTPTDEGGLTTDALAQTPALRDFVEKSRSDVK
jgi:serine/threonine protein kinase